MQDLTPPSGRRVHGTWESVTSTPGNEVVSEAEINVGSGAHLVYGLYDPRQREAARAEGNERWLIKVGKTRGRSPYDRIQDGAFLPDKLTWGIAIWTDSPDSVEKLV